MVAEASGEASGIGLVAAAVADIPSLETFCSEATKHGLELSFSSLKYEQELFTQDSVLREKRDRWHQTLAKDVYVEEALNVLQDLKLENFSKDRLASRLND